MRACLCVYYVYDDDWRIARHSLLYFWCSNDAVQCETVGHRARCDMCPVSEQCWLHTICGLSIVFDMHFYTNQQLCIICGNVKCCHRQRISTHQTSMQMGVLAQVLARLMSVTNSAQGFLVWRTLPERLMPFGHRPRGHGQMPRSHPTTSSVGGGTSTAATSKWCFRHRD